GVMPREVDMAPVAVSERGYSRPELLAETGWLAEHLADPSVRIIDTRQAPLYAEGHIPGAANLAAAGSVPRTENGDMGSPEEFAALAGKLGVSNSSSAVVYDAPGAAMGTVAWAVMYYGHSDVRMLDGGYSKWTRGGRAVSAGASS